MKIDLGIIGGSGLYDIDGISNIEEVKVSTPFGEPSSEIVIGQLSGKRVAFLPRHGKGHRLSPHEINYRANIYALKKLGVSNIVSVSAVGSMKEDIHPGDIVIVDQFFDNTKKRISTFFGDGITAHVSMADPVCPILSDLIYKTSSELGYVTYKKGTYLCMEGPQFSTRAESNIYRSWGIDVIGMTNMPEAKLAREAQICYATMAMVTDYDCWHESEENVSVEAIIETLMNNVKKGKEIIKKILPLIDHTDCACRKALESAVITNPEVIPERKKKELEIIKN